MMPYHPHASVPSTHALLPLEPFVHSAPFVELKRFTSAAYSGPLFSPACAETDSIANTPARPQATRCRNEPGTESAGEIQGGRSERFIGYSSGCDRRLAPSPNGDSKKSGLSFQRWLAGRPNKQGNSRTDRVKGARQARLILLLA